MFGPPGIMDCAGRGEYGDGVCPEYGLFPRGMIEIFRQLQEHRHSAEGQGMAYVLTVSAVEISMLGNVDMFVKAGDELVQEVSFANWRKGASAFGVCVDRKSKPVPRLYGMTELIVERAADLRLVFRALACRNTAGTGMNDSSSRSHCFAFLNLFAHDAAADTVRTTRFQFVDLAGSEKLKDAHGQDVRPSWSSTDMELVNGMLTNFSLSMLSSAVRNLLDHRRKARRAKAKGAKPPPAFSFRLFLFDLVLLLQDSLTGAAMTAIFVCISQAPDNASQTRFALEFGEQFAKLNLQRKLVPGASYTARTQLCLSGVPTRYR
jgi:kinesin family protein 4/21/27